MSRLGALANKIGRLETTLQELNQALVLLQVASLQRTEEFGISPTSVSDARHTMSTFFKSVLKSLDREKSPFALTVEDRTWRNIADGLLATGIGAEDWYSDLDEASTLLEKGQLTKMRWDVVQQVLDVFDNDIADDLRRIEGW